MVEMDGISGIMTSRSSPSPLLDLPEEIWALIFDFVPQDDLTAQRFVNKNWCKKIDSLGNYHVKFSDDQSPGLLETIFRQRVRACNFHGLKYSFEPKFQNPVLVKEITFASNSLPENVRKILLTCTAIERLEFFTTLSTDRLFDPTQDYNPVWNNLKKLSEIEIGIQCFQNRGVNSRSSIFETLVQKSEVVFPSLRRVKLNYPMMVSEWGDLFKFLARHSKTLRSLKVRCFRCGDKDGILDLDMSLLKKLNLSTLEIYCESGCRGSRVHEAFAELVSAQRNLEKVHLDLIKFPLHVFIDAVRNCGPKLRSIMFLHVEFGPEAPVEGSLFSECVLLRELTFHCVPRYTVIITVMGYDDDVGNPVRYEGSDILGWSLPPSLTHLSLEGCLIPTSELIDCTTEHNCSQLQTLELYNVTSGITAGFGVSFDAFLQLLENLAYLNVLRIREVSYCGSVREKQNWTRMVARAVADGICTCDEGCRVVEFDELREHSFTFKFRSCQERIDFLNNIKELSDLDSEANQGEGEDTVVVEVDVDEPTAKKARPED